MHNAPITMDTLRLIRSENVGPVTFFQLLKRYGSVAAALEAIPELSARGGSKRPIILMSQEDAETEITKTYTSGAKMLTWFDEDYPALLKHIHDAPPLITYMGNVTQWKEHDIIGIVGVRNASANGCLFANKIAVELGRFGIVVASGLARGIDAAAHKGALDAGTIAVIAGGINTIYPPENASLQQAIAERGAIITEHAFGAAPHPQKFLSRNRIISGLSLGVLVVEAPTQSGSLVTASCALEQGREVFSVPGSPLDPRCKGTNTLLRQGAVLTESANDIFEHIKSVKGARISEQPPAAYESDAITPLNNDSELDEARNLVVEKLGATPVLVDELIVQCQLTPNLLLHILLELELAGRLVRSSGNRVCLRYNEG